MGLKSLALAGRVTELGLKWLNSVFSCLEVRCWCALPASALAFGTCLPWDGPLLESRGFSGALHGLATGYPTPSPATEVG